MEFRKKETFIFIVLQFLQMKISCLSLPKSISNNLRANGNVNVQNLKNYPLQSSRNLEIGGGQLEKNYPYFRFQDPYNVALSSNTQNDGFMTHRNTILTDNEHNIPTIITKNEQHVPGLFSEFVNGPHYRDVGTFPEVEYPLSAYELWKPNYWNVNLRDAPFDQLNDFTYIDSKPNQSPTDENSLSNYVKNIVGVPIKITSYSNPTKNVMHLRNIAYNPSKLGSSKSNSTISENCITNMLDDFYNAHSQDEHNGSEYETNFKASLLQSPISQLDLSNFYTTLPSYTLTTCTTPIPNSYDSIKSSDAMSTIDTDLNTSCEINAISQTEIDMAPYCTNNNGGNKIKITPDSPCIKNVQNTLEISYDDKEYIFLSRPEITNKLLPNVDKENNSNIIVDEEYTTDEPQYEGSFYTQSTMVPQTLSTEDYVWKNSQVIEKTVIDVDELDDYFMSV